MMESETGQHMNLQFYQSEFFHSVIFFQYFPKYA